MQIHKKSGNLDNDATRLTGNAAYWAKRMPRTFAQSGGRFIEASKEEVQSREKAVAEIIQKGSKRARALGISYNETKEEREARRRFQRQEVITILRYVKTTSVRDLISIVCYLQDLSVDKFMGARQSREVVLARAAVSILAHGFGHSFSHIGRCLGRDHSTIMHHWKKFQDDKEVRHLVKKTARVIRWEGRNK